MVLEEVCTSERFAQLASEWNELLDASSSRCVFLTHEWLFTWWKHLSQGQPLSIVVARDHDRLLGILPAILRPPELVRMTPQMFVFLGSGLIGSDYLDVIIRTGFEHEVLSAFGDWLDRAGHIVQFSQLRSGACATEFLARHLAGRGWTASQTTLNVCPFVELRGHTWETYLASLSSSHRYNFQRRFKGLKALPGFRVEQPSTPDEAMRALDVSIVLHQKRWQARAADSEAFHTDAIRAFHREFVRLAFDRGWLRLSTMWIGDRPVAALYGLRYAKVFSFYQSGFDPEFAKQSVGLVMMGLTIQNALEEDCTEYDLLHGGEDYKSHWARETRDLGRIELFPAHARLYRQAIGVNRAIRRMTSRVLQKL